MPCNRKRGRVVEGSSLENCRRCEPFVSSNLTASATARSSDWRGVPGRITLPLRQGYASKSVRQGYASKRSRPNCSRLARSGAPPLVATHQRMPARCPGRRVGRHVLPPLMSSAISAAISSVVCSAVLRARRSASDGLKAMTSCFVNLCQMGSSTCSPLTALVTIPSSS